MYSSFLEIFKKKEKEVEYTKYFIPCYDVINNEIYFSEFFTEEIISKDTKIPDIREREKSIKNNISMKIKIENINKKKKEIGVLKLTEEEKKILLQKRKENLLLSELALSFKKMLLISGFNENNYLSINYYNYFSRPLYSHFFLPQNLHLCSFNSTQPIQNSIMTYSFIDIYIDFHLDSLLGINLDQYLIEFNENDQEYDYDNYESEKSFEVTQQIVTYLQIKKNLSDLFKNSKRISLFYVVDTLIKDSVKLFEDYLNILKLIDF